MSSRIPPRDGVRPGRMRYSAVELLIAIVLLFFVTPFVQNLPYGPLIEVLMFSLVLVSAVLAIGARGRTLWIGGSLCAAVLGTKWTQHFFPHLLPVWLFHAAALLFLGYVVLQLLGFIMRAPEGVSSEILCAAFAAYLLIGLVWALNYVLLARLSPEAFAFSSGPEANRTMTSFNAFYFSFVVLSSVGFGDITPVSPAARLLTVTEAITGMFYVTVLISRLVAMYVPRTNRNSPTASDKP